MALTRKFLTALGIEADKVDEIISAHSETVEALKGERDKYKAQAESAEEIQKKLDATEKELKTIKDAGDFKAEYDKIKNEFEKFKADIKSEKTKQEKTALYKELLKEAGISEKRIDTVLRVSGAEIDKLEVVENKIKDADKLKEALKKEWSDFVTTTEVQGTNPQNPPKTDPNQAIGTSLAAKRMQAYQQSHYGTPIQKEG